MLIYYKPASKTIYGINDDLAKEDAQEYVGNNCIWLDMCEIPSLCDNQEWYLTDDYHIGVRESVVHEPSQLDIIQAAVEKSNSELRQEGAETVILELVERGIL